MCVIMIHKAGDSLPRSEFRAGWRANSDGGGYMFQRDGRVCIRKPFWTCAEMWKAYRADVKRNPDTPFVVHFRITTHGAENKVNTHPHRLPNKCAIAHNGVISGFGDSSYGWMKNTVGAWIKDDRCGGVSDTVDYARTILGRLPRYWWRNPGIRYLIESNIGRGNKIAVLPDHGKVVLLNQKYWYTRKGRIYSNLGWMTRTSRVGSQPDDKKADDEAKKLTDKLRAAADRGSTTANREVYRSTQKVEKPPALSGEQGRAYTPLDPGVVYKRVCGVCDKHVRTNDRAQARCGCPAGRWIYFGNARPGSRYAGWCRYVVEGAGPGWVFSPDDETVAS